MTFLKNISAAFFVAGLLVFGLAGSGRAADPNVTVTPVDPTFLPGETVTYNVTMLNDTAAPIENATYRFYLKNTPASITGSTLPSAVSGEADGEPFIQTSLPQTLGVDESSSYQVTVALPIEYAGPTFKATAEILDSTGAIMENKTSTINKRVPIIDLTKTAASTVRQGAVIQYTITAINKGFAPATNIVLRDTPPNQLAYIPSTGPTTCSIAVDNTGASTITCEPFSLNPTQQRVITLDFTVSPTTPCGTKLTNNAGLTADGLDSMSASAVTTITCQTPPTPTPEIIYVEKKSDDNSSSGSGSASSNSSSTAKPKGQVKGARTTAGHTAAQQKEPGYIPSKYAPIYVELLFKQLYNRKPTVQESAYWKNRARTDKYTVAKLRDTMLWYKGQGITVPVKLSKTSTAARPVAQQDR